MIGGQAGELTGRKILNARLMILAAALCAIMAIAVGCGSDDDSTTTTSADAVAAGEEGGSEGGQSDSPPVAQTSMSKAAVKKKATAACKQTRKGLSAEQEAYIAEHVEDGLEQGQLFANMTREVLVPRIEAEAETIRENGAPVGDEGKVEAILAAQEAGVAQLAALEELSSNEELEKPFAKANKLRQSYGFPVCSYIP